MNCKRILALLVTVVLPLLIAPAAGLSRAEGSDAGIMASRLTAEFRLDPVTSPECDRSYPAVAYNQDQREFLVVWHNWWSYSYQDIYARRVTSAGAIKSWFSVADGGYTRVHPSAAYNPATGEYLVVWMYDALGDGTHWEIWGRLVAWNGAYRKPEFQILSWPNRGYWWPRVVWNSLHNEYLVVASVYDTAYLRWNDVARRRVAADGSTPWAGGAIYQNPTVEPTEIDVAYNPAVDEYLAVWRQAWSSTDRDIYGARLRGDNAAVIVPPDTFVIDGALQDQLDPSVTSTGQGHYLLFWQQAVDIPPANDWHLPGRELDSNGNYVGSTPWYPYAGSAEVERYLYADVASNGATAPPVVVFQGLGPGISEVLLAELGASGSWAGYTVAAGAASVPPAVAAGPPGHYLIVYGKAEGGTVHIYGRMYRKMTIYLPLIVR